MTDTGQNVTKDMKTLLIKIVITYLSCNMLNQ